MKNFISSLNDVQFYFLRYYIAIFICGIALSCLIRLYNLLSPKKLRLLNHFELIFIGFSFLGLTLGILTGGSRTPIAQGLITGILTVYGGIVSYIFFNEKFNNADNRRIAILSLVLITFGSIMGTEVGAYYRMKAEEFSKTQDQVNAQTMEQFKVDVEIYKLRVMKAEKLKTE